MAATQASRARWPRGRRSRRSLVGLAAALPGLVLAQPGGAGTDLRSALGPPLPPPEPSAWPPAPAAMALALTALLLLGLAAYALGRRHRRQAWRRAALRELRQIEAAGQPPVQVSAWLRRVARARAGSAVAALGDADFAQWLATHPAWPGGRAAGADEPLADFVAACAHRPRVQVDAQDLARLRHWVRRC